MRLLNLTLPLLLVASTALAGSTFEEPQTTIETIYETVTRTIIHDVTDPTVARDASKDEKLAAAYKRLDEIQAKLDDTKHVVRTLEEAAGITSTAVAPTFAADTNTTVIATARQCTVKEFNACRQESDAEMGTCMDSCIEHIESYGSEKEEYTNCFNKFNASILAAEECLFKNKTAFYNSGKDDKTIDTINWDDFTNFTYSPEVTKENNSTIWKTHEPKYTKLQNFFHCTKNCMHKKFGTCTTTTGCAVKMPSQSDFESKMNKCTKKNYKVTNAIFSTCHCLAWQNQVKELQGSCVYVGSQYYIDRA